MHGFSTSVRSLFRLTLLGLLMLIAGTALAQSGGITTLPSPRVKNRSGLTMEVDTRWVDGNGYRPITIRVWPSLGGAAPADRTVQVSLTFHEFPGNRRTRVATSIELQQGQVVAEKQIPAHASGVWHSQDISVTEDGRSWPDLTVTNRGFVRNYYEWDDASPTVLLVDDDAPAYESGVKTRTMSKEDELRLPDFRALAGSLPVDYWNGSINQQSFRTVDATSDPELVTLATLLPRLDVLPSRSLPKNWLCLTGIDMMCISLDDLRTLATMDVERWSAVRRWLSTGTVLVVYGAGDEFEKLAELEQLLDVPVLDADAPYRGWGPPDVKEYGKAAFDNSSYQLVQQRPVPLNDKKTKTKTPPTPTPFVVRPVEGGRLVAYASDNPFPGNRDSWNWLLRSLTPNQWMWYRRFGFSMQRENEEYWNLLIPGVGESPVNSFLILISLFVMVIGPINYFYLQKRRQLYLLLITVPLGAFLVTGSLLTYAVLTDGFGVQSRQRNITQLDQRSQRAVSFSRQCYYAGLAPSDGLRYPADTAVLPLKFRPQVDAPGLRHTLWGKRQNLRTGYFRSRTTTQFLVVDSRRSEAQLKIGDPSPSGEVQVENLLGADIGRLVVRLDDGRYFATTTIADGESGSLEEVKSGDESEHWRELLGSHAPKYPEGFDPQQIENAALHLFGIYAPGGGDPASSPTFQTSVAERAIVDHGARNLLNLPRRHYLAECKAGVEVPLGTDAKPRKSFHIVVGTW